MTPPNPSPEAREAAVAIVDGYMKSFLDDEEVKQGIASIIQSALDSAQRPYVEWIMKAYHAPHCLRNGVDPTQGNDECTCGLSLLRDELRKQVGDNL